MSVYGSEEFHDLGCDPCNDKGTSQRAVKYCPLCDELLCTGCVRAHIRNKVLKTHPLNDDLSDSFKRKGIHPLALCDKHKTEKLEQYCETHNVLCCEKCRFVTHNSCKIIAIKEKSQADNQSKLLQDCLQMIQSLQQNVKRIKTTYEEGIKSLKINKEQCFTEVRALKKEVDDLFKTLENEVLDEFERSEAIIKSKLDSQIAEGAKLLQQLNECHGMLVDCQSARDNEVIFIGIEKSRDDIKRMAKLVAELQDIIIAPDLQFEAQQEVTNMTKTLKRLGSVKSETPMELTALATCATHSVLGVNATSQSTSDNKTGTSTGDTVQATSGTVNMLGVTVSSQRALGVSSSCISGSAFLESGELVLCDSSNNKILLLNPDLTMKNDLQLPGEPFDVSAIMNHRVVVTIPSYKRLQFVEMAPTMKKSNRVKCKSPCYGTSSTKSHLYVLLNDADGQPEISVLGHDGSHVRTITLSPFGIKDPFYITVNRHGDIVYVSDSHVCGGSSSVTCLDYQTGTKLFRYSSNNPRGLYLDDNNNLLVCGAGSQNISVLTAEGRHERILLSRIDGLKRPLTVTYRPADGTLVVGMEDASPCRVFRLKSK